MKNLISLALVLQFTQLSLAEETTDRDAVIDVVQEFFDAMTARDADKMRSMMTSDGILYGYRESDEGLQIIRPTHNAYLENLATGEGHLVERFWDPEVMVGDRLATVWTPYDFHVDGIFSHCGVNNFSMLRTDERWIITGVVFSMQRENCEESPLGPPSAVAQ